MIRKTIAEMAQMVKGELILHSAKETDMVEGVSIDSRSIEMNNLYVPLLGERVDGHRFIADVVKKGATLVLCSDRNFIPQDVAVILVKDTLVALQDLATNYRQSLHAKVIGITGSNGKTSCKDILAGALSATFKTQKTLGNRNSEIGVPLTLLSLDEDVEVAIIEMGMENLDEIHFLNTLVNQEIALITNVGIAHLENLGSLENIGHAKLEIVDNLKSNGLFLYNGDDEILSKLMKVKQIPKGVSVQTFGFDQKNYVYLTSCKQTEQGIYFTINGSEYEFHLNLLGEHQASNALGAIAIAYHLGLQDDAIQKGFDRMEKTSMRNELLSLHKCTILNDAYKSNPQSAMAALATLQLLSSPYKICILGDMLELGNTSKHLHFDLGCQLQHYHIDEIICVGTLAQHIKEGVISTGRTSSLYCFEGIEEVFEHIKDYIDKDCLILLKGSRGMALDQLITRMKEYGDNNG